MNSEKISFNNLVARLDRATLVTALAFAVLFFAPIRNTAFAWWREPDAGHGLLLFPISLYLIWKSGISAKAKPNVKLGLVIIVGAVALRYASGLAAEWFTMRWSVLVAVAGLIVYRWGLEQLKFWWLPAALLALSVPIPTILLNTIAFPLQLKASQLGAEMLDWRNVPVLLSGNVIHLPGRSLFVTEACSGLRSLTALISLGVLVGGMWLRTPIGRLSIIVATIPVAVFLNGVRVFLTGFLVHFVDPSLGAGFMHMTEGWLIFVVAFGILGLIGKVVISAEDWFSSRTEVA